VGADADDIDSRFPDFSDDRASFCRPDVQTDNDVFRPEDAAYLVALKM